MLRRRDHRPDTDYINASYVRSSRLSDSSSSVQSSNESLDSVKCELRNWNWRGKGSHGTKTYEPILYSITNIVQVAWIDPCEGFSDFCLIFKLWLRMIKFYILMSDPRSPYHQSFIKRFSPVLYLKFSNRFWEIYTNIQKSCYLWSSDSGLWIIHLIKVKPVQINRHSGLVKLDHKICT